MERINTVFRDLPASIRGFTVNYYDSDAGLTYYTIFINSMLNTESRALAFRHELEHIIKDDFNAALDVDALELVRHEEVKL